MRTKDEIINQLVEGLHKVNTPIDIDRLQTEMLIEIFIDIRDIIKEGFEDIDSAINNISLRP